MFFGLSDDAQALAAGVRELLADACPPDVVRAAWPGGDPEAVEKLWSSLGELGLFGLLVPESAGGLGLDDLVAVAALQEAGYAAVPGPLVETVAVAAPLLAAAGAMPEGLLAGALPVAVQRAELVPYAERSELIVQLDGPPRLLRPAAAKLAPVPTTDGSRAAARVRGDGEPLGVAASDEARALHRGALGTAAFLVGLSRRMLDLTVGYVSTREQFGVPVGSFQAVQHPLADALVAVEFAAPAVLRAAQSLVDDDPADHRARRDGEGARLRRRLPGRARQHPGARRDGLHGGVRPAPLRQARLGDGRRLGQRRRAPPDDPASPATRGETVTAQTQASTPDHPSATNGAVRSPSSPWTGRSSATRRTAR